MVRPEGPKDTIGELLIAMIKGWGMLPEGFHFGGQPHIGLENIPLLLPPGKSVDDIASRLLRRSSTSSSTVLEGDDRCATPISKVLFENKSPDGKVLAHVTMEEWNAFQQKFIAMEEQLLKVQKHDVDLAQLNLKVDKNAHVCHSNDKKLSHDIKETVVLYTANATGEYENHCLRSEEIRQLKLQMQDKFTHLKLDFDNAAAEMRLKVQSISDNIGNLTMENLSFGRSHEEEVAQLKLSLDKHIQDIAEQLGKMQYFSDGDAEALRAHKFEMLESIKELDVKVAQVQRNMTILEVETQKDLDDKVAQLHRNMTVLDEHIRENLCADITSALGPLKRDIHILNGCTAGATQQLREAVVDLRAQITESEMRLDSRIQLAQLAQTDHQSAPMHDDELNAIQQELQRLRLHQDGHEMVQNTLKGRITSFETRLLDVIRQGDRPFRPWDDDPITRDQLQEKLTCFQDDLKIHDCLQDEYKKELVELTNQVNLIQAILANGINATHPVTIIHDMGEAEALR